MARAPSASTVGTCLGASGCGPRVSGTVIGATGVRISSLVAVDVVIVTPGTVPTARPARVGAASSCG